MLAETGFCLIHHGRAENIRDQDGQEAALRHRLWEMGLRPGMTLACQFRDRALYARLLFLLPRLGCVFLPMDPDLPAVVRDQLLQAAGGPVCLDDASLLRDAGQNMDSGREAWRPLQPWQPCLLLATSGTGGRPRLVELTAEALIASARAACDFLQLQAADGWLACLPLHHIGGLSILLRCACRGARAVLTENFSPPDVMSLLREHRLTHVSLVPSMLYRLLEEETVPPSSVRVVLLGGAPASRSLVHQALERGWPVCPSYGLTEAASQVATWYPPDPDWQAGAAGRVLPHLQVEIAAPDGAIRIRGASVARYWRNTRGERQALTDAQGWLDTGDAGWLDDQGHLHVRGRRDHMLISGGENLCPEMLEALFDECPGIGPRAITSLDDPRWGDALVLLYQGDVDAQAVRAWARDHLKAGFVPRHFVRVEGLPRNSLGKLLRKRLRALAARALQESF